VQRAKMPQKSVTGAITRCQPAKRQNQKTARQRIYFCIQAKTVHDGVRIQGAFPQFKFLPFSGNWV
jgi:hypothetical protein